MDTELRPVCLALFDVSCVALDLSRRVEAYPAGVVLPATRDRVLTQLIGTMDQLAGVQDLLEADLVGEPPDWNEVLKSNDGPYTLGERT
jgi:hypothetical protein